MRGTPMCLQWSWKKYVYLYRPHLLGAPFALREDGGNSIPRSFCSSPICYRAMDGHWLQTKQNSYRWPSSPGLHDFCLVPLKMCCSFSLCQRNLFATEFVALQPWDLWNSTPDGLSLLYLSLLLQGIRISAEL